MTLNINLTRRVRHRKLKDGSTVEQTRYVLNWRDPRSGDRRQQFFETQRVAGRGAPSSSRHMTAASIAPQTEL